MDAEALGAILGGMAAVIGALGGAAYKILTIIRTINATAEQRLREEMHYRDRREDILRRRIEVVTDQMSTIAREAGIELDGVFGTKMANLDREWAVLVGGRD